MKIHINDARFLRMAQAALPKNDIRKYLNYLLFELDTLTLVATNGHILVSANDTLSHVFEEGEKLDETRLLIKPSQKIPASWVAADLDLSSGVMTGYTEHGAHGTMVACEIKTEKDFGCPYPQWRAVIPTEPTGEPTSIIGFNPEYPAMLAKAAKSKMVALKMDGSKNGRMLEFDGIPKDQVTCILMPGRV